MKKSMIPKVLTILRLVLTLASIVLGLLFTKYKIVAILAVIGALTNIDSILAKKWNIEIDEKMLKIANIAFPVGLVLSLAKQARALRIPLILEILLIVIYVLYYKKNNRTDDLVIDKFKLTALYLAIILSMICVFNAKMDFLKEGFILATLNLEILCLINHIVSYFSDESEESLEKTRKVFNHPDKIYDYELEKTKKIDNLKDLIS